MAAAQLAGKRVEALAGFGQPRFARRERGVELGGPILQTFDVLAEAVEGEIEAQADNPPAAAMPDPSRKASRRLITLLIFEDLIRCRFECQQT
ncbi:MAG: hypothetical protein AAFX50_06700 [Acidobacteriota bacterium]